MIIDKQGNVKPPEVKRPHRVLLTARHHMIGERTLPRLRFYLPVGVTVAADLSEEEFAAMAQDPWVLMQPKPTEEELRDVQEAPIEAPAALLPGNAQMLESQTRIVHHDVGVNVLRAVA